MQYISFTLNSSGPILEITLSKGKANVVSAADSRELNELKSASSGKFKLSIDVDPFNLL